MRKRHKQQVEELVRQLEQAHDQIRKYIDQNNIQATLELLEDCQSAGISIGTLIEQSEGEDNPTVFMLEEYCELVYQIHETLNINEVHSTKKSSKLLRQKMIRISNSIRNEIRVKKEAVFLPYKASMWDSMESVWQAADADPDCDAYVIPIPYFDKNPDGSFRAMHYEADQFAADIPVIKYDEFDFEVHQPDIIFIHNPYDNINFVTSIHPYFYSENIKKFTDCLVYIPYYATAGGMSEGQSLCPAYAYADYIIIQAEKYRQYFDARIPDNKFLALGSPKFDRVIHKCQNPPIPPQGWDLGGKKVYFFNTSIGGMLGNTEVFLKKMRYVFDIFKGRDDVCLLWRPHPLMESTFDSMRSMYKPWYEALKKEFIDEKIGIYDDTPDIERTIALSDAYISDTLSSVTALFGVAGKPIFTLNNYIQTLPEQDDWRGERINIQFDAWGDDRYQVTKSNQIWYSENNDYHYKFYMDLETGYFAGGYYLRALEIRDRLYVFPGNAQHLLVIQNKKIRKIEFKKYNLRGAAFNGYWYNDKYLYMFPFMYPQLVRFTIETEELCYIENVKPFYLRQNAQGEWRQGGIGEYENELIFASPEDDQFLFMDVDTLKIRMLCSNTPNLVGAQGWWIDGEELWLVPIKGTTIICWNFQTGESREYSGVPETFRALKWPYESETDEYALGSIAIFGKKGEGEKEKIIITPNRGNMYLELDRDTGKIKEWKLPIGCEMRGKNGYFLTDGMGGFVIAWQQVGKPDCRVWYAPERKLYDINVFTKEYKEVEIEFDYEDLNAHEPGFMEESEWMQYSLGENAFNSLKDFLDGKITGNQYDREKQLEAFSKINANTDGTCGKTIYEYIKKNG